MIQPFTALLLNIFNLFLKAWNLKSDTVVINGLALSFRLFIERRPLGETTKPTLAFDMIA